MPNNPESKTENSIQTAFHKDGFAIVQKLASLECIKALKEAYYDILNRRVECGEHDRQLGGLTRQVIMPHLYHPVFASNEAVSNGRKIASELIGWPDPELSFSMAIYKPPGHMHETPWHQDMAYAGRPITPAGTKLPHTAIAQFWLALEDVDEDMGCMEFIPGFLDRPMPEHFVASGDPADDGRLLAIKNPESVLNLSTTVKCPLKAGSATVHGYTTPHYTGPNKSPDRGRPAFIFSFANPELFETIASAETLEVVGKVT